MIITKSPRVLLSLFLMTAGSYFTPGVVAFFPDEDVLKAAVDQYCDESFDSDGSEYG
jgi:hypothetical protein